MASKDARRTVLHANLEADDHDSAALFVRTDGRYVAAYSRHNTDGLTRWRVSFGSGSETAWRPEQTFDHGAGTTYSNLYSAQGVDDRLYNFVRSAGRDPHFLVSDDNGSTWTFGGRLLNGPGRPYVRYATDGIGRVHLVTTEQHPLDFGNSIYHGVIDDGQLRRADGTPVDTDLSDGVAVDPTRLTKVFAGDDGHRAWTVDLQIDAAGQPYAAFSVRSPAGHRYHYARFDGVRWRVHLLAHAGRGLYAAEPDYTGLVALDPRDPSRLVISTDAHPVTGRPLISGGDGQRHYELFEGVTIDDGATWSWTALTADSTVDNIRPIIPPGDADHAALLWLRGTYSSYKVYDLDVVGLLTQLPAGRRSCTQGGQIVRSEVDSCTVSKTCDGSGGPAGWALCSQWCRSFSWCLHSSRTIGLLPVRASCTHSTVRSPTARLPSSAPRWTAASRARPDRRPWC
jgi:hypothetical protein